MTKNLRQDVIFDEDKPSEKSKEQTEMYFLCAPSKDVETVGI